MELCIAGKNGRAGIAANRAPRTKQKLAIEDGTDAQNLGPEEGTIRYDCHSRRGGMAGESFQEN